MILLIPIVLYILGYPNALVTSVSVIILILLTIGSLATILIYERIFK